VQVANQYFQIYQTAFLVLGIFASFQGKKVVFSMTQTPLAMIH